MGGSIQELYLFRLQAVDGIGIHLYQYIRIGMASFYTGAGYIMCLFRQVLRDENVLAGFYYAGIIDVYILYEEPGPDTIGSPGTMLFGQLQHIIVE